ncbi:MAG: GWxTD domain-containing protein [Candidatus Saccharicenans sp.]
MKRSKKYLSYSLAGFFLVVALMSCATSRQEKSLDAASEEFLSKVRYIITPEEREAFLQLSPSERPKFIEDFWKRRDPNPKTPVNEFKEAYFRRINEANQLFSELGTAGWLTDRGRVWILLGRPDSRERYPFGYELYQVPAEIWYYGGTQIIFVDRFWSGHYELEESSARRVDEMTQAWLAHFQPEKQEAEVSPALDFELKVKKTEAGQALISISLPYSHIWFNARGEKFEALLEVSAEIDEASGKKVWTFKRTYPLSLSLEELKQNFDQDYVIELNASFSGQSPFLLKVTLENQLEKRKAEKSLKFEF